MLRFLKGISIAVLIFVSLNFLFWNMDEHTLTYPVQLRFTIPYLLDLRSMPMPVGFMILASFCIGLVIAALLGLFQFFYRHAESRAQRKQIRKLESRVQELEGKLYALEGRSSREPSTVSF